MTTISPQALISPYTSSSLSSATGGNNNQTSVDSASTLEDQVEISLEAQNAFDQQSAVVEPGGFPPRPDPDPPGTGGNGGN